MPKRVNIPGVGQVNFPDAMSDDEIASEAGRLYDEAQGASVAPRAAASEPKSVSGFAGNLLQSGKRFASDAVSGLGTAAKLGLASAPPVLFARSVRDAFAGESQPLEEERAIGEAITHPWRTAKAVGRGLADRYGSLEAIGETLYNDPIGAAADVATIAAPTARFSRIGRAAQAADPAATAVRAARAIAPGEAKLTNASRRVASSVLKVKDTLARRNPHVDIPLEAAKQGARISEGSARTIGKEISGLKGDVTKAVDAAEGAIRPSDVALDARDLLRKRKALGSVAEDDVAQIRDEIRKFVGTNEPLTPAQVQAAKEFLGEKLKTKFGADTTAAKVDAQQALRVGAKRAIEQAVPSVASANAAMSKKIPVQRAILDAKKRLDKRETSGVRLGDLGLGGAAGYAAGDPLLGGAIAAGSALARKAAKDPSNRMRLASGLYRAGQAAGPTGEAFSKVAPLATRAAVADRALSSDGEDVPGLLEPGNIDLDTRPIAENGDGTISTVRSMSIEVDGQEVLIPTISDDGRALSDDDAIAEFERTGRHLGVFDSVDAANAYAEQLHQQQAARYAPRRKRGPLQLRR